MAMTERRWTVSASTDLSSRPLRGHELVDARPGTGRIPRLRRKRHLAAAAQAERRRLREWRQRRNDALHLGELARAMEHEIAAGLHRGARARRKIAFQSLHRKVIGDQHAIEAHPAADHLCY